jgi:hypothetical protein
MRSHLVVPVLFVLPLALMGCSSAPSTPTNANTLAAAPVTLGAPEISPDLAVVAREVRVARRAARAATFSTSAIRVNDQGEIQVHIYVTHWSSHTRNAIVAAGATDISASRLLGLYQYRAWASPSAVAKIGALSGVYKVAPPLYEAASDTR